MGGRANCAGQTSSVGAHLSDAILCSLCPRIAQMVRFPVVVQSRYRFCSCSGNTVGWASRSCTGESAVSAVSFATARLGELIPSNGSFLGHWSKSCQSAPPNNPVTPFPHNQPIACRLLRVSTAFSKTLNLSRNCCPLDLRLYPCLKRRTNNARIVENARLDEDNGWIERRRR
jgi:hypothetical protein